MNRRNFIRAAMTAAVLIPFARVLTACKSDGGAALPAGVAKIDPVNNPTAKALGYIEDAGQANDPAYKPGATCKNCQFYKETHKGWGPCQLIADPPNAVVAGPGWCKSWVKTAS